MARITVIGAQAGAARAGAGCVRRSPQDMMCGPIFLRPPRWRSTRAQPSRRCRAGRGAADATSYDTATFHDALEGSDYIFLHPPAEARADRAIPDRGSRQRYADPYRREARGVEHLQLDS